ncbi:hypothetical protein LTS17_001948 [Exophiala oligosperma]
MLESTDAILMGTSIVLSLSTLVSISVQLERQLTTAGRLDASKWFLVTSAVFAMIMTGLVCAAAAHGLGASISREEFGRREKLQKVQPEYHFTLSCTGADQTQLLIAVLPPYFLCNMFVKHAWLTFYYALARTRTQRWIIHFMQLVAFGFGISSILVILLQCIPLSHVWTRARDPPPEDDAHCVNLMAYFYFNAAFMVVNDTVMYMLPVFLLRNVDMLRGHRWGIYTLFAVGGVVVLASILRLIAVHELDKSNNFSENYALIFLWAAVENHLGICVACAGAVKQKTIRAVDSIRKSYGSIRHKPWPPTSFTMVTQDTEHRNLYTRPSSMPSPTAASDNKDGDVHLELHQVPSNANTATTVTSPV